MDKLIALVGFSFVSSVTPGPNNVLLWASGSAFGFGASVRHIAGTALGIATMALVVGAGFGTLLTALPDHEFVMKVAASVYLLYLAYQVAGAHAFEQGELARPLGLRQAAAFQAINPKAWIFALGAVTAFVPPELPVATGIALVALTMAVVVLPTAALWAAAGGIISRAMAGERTRRVVALLFVALLAATVVSLWA